MSFQAEAALFGEAADIGSAGEIVAGVELDSGFGGEDTHHAAGGWLFDFRCEHRLFGRITAAVDDPAVIVALRLIRQFAEVGSDGFRFREVHRAVARHVGQLAGRDRIDIDGDELIAVQSDDVVENIAALRSRTFQVPVGVIREIDRSGLVSRGGVLDAQFVLVGQLVGDDRGQCAGIAFVAVGTDERQLHSGPAFPLNRLGIPDVFVERLLAAVQMIRTVVRRERVLGPVECELALRDAIAVAATQHAEVRRIGCELGVVRSQIADNVVEFAVAVGCLDRRQDAAEVEHDRAQAVLVRERELLQRFAFDFGIEFLSGDEGGLGHVGLFG